MTFKIVDLPFDPPVVYFFQICQLVGLVGWIAILLTCLLSQNVRRHPSWYGFNISWVFSCGSYSFLMLTGQQFRTPPLYALCLAQSAAIYAAPALSAFTTLSLVLQLLFSFKSMLNTSSSTKQRIRAIFLIALPFIVSTGIYVMGLVEGLLHRDQVRLSHKGVYCTVETGTPGKIVAILVFVVMVVVLGCEAFIVYTIKKNRTALRSLGSRSRQSITMMIRVGIFTFFAMFAIVVATIMLSDFNNPVPNIFLALLPIIALLVFGTQRDILRVWTFWRTTEGTTYYSENATVYKEQGVAFSVERDRDFIMVQQSKFTQSDSGQSWLDLNKEVGIAR